MSAARGVSPYRVLLYAAVIGGVGGVALAFRKQHQVDEELQAAILRQQRSDEVEAQAQYVPGAPQPSRLPRVVGLEAVHGLPPYPGAYVRPLSEQVSAQGVEMNIAWFETRDSVDDVLGFYRQKFKEAGKWGVWHRYSENAGYAGYLDHEVGRMHLISAIHQGGKTMVFPSLSYPGKMMGASASMPESVPAIAGAEGSLVFDFGDGARLSKVLLATVRQQSLRQVVDGYKRALAERGWAIDEKLGATDAQARVEARRVGSGGLQVEFKRDTDSTVAVYVTMLPDV